MANANRQVTSGNPISAAFGWTAGGLLLALGAALQLGELGYGPYSAANRWVFSVVAKGAWHMLMMLDGPALKYMMQYWPLTIVLLGLVILPMAWNRQRGGARLAADSEIGEDHGG